MALGGSSFEARKLDENDNKKQEETTMNENIVG